MDSWLSRSRQVLFIWFFAGAAGLFCPDAHADSNYDRGVALYNQRNFKAAAESFDLSIRSSPADSNAHYYAALTYQQLGDWSRAKQLYRTIVERFPGSQAAVLAAGVLQKYDPAFKGGRQSSTSSSSGRAGSAPEPRSYFLAQNNDPRFNRDAPINDANCCPTCLAMACKRFDVYPSGMNSNTTAQKLILGTRLMMMAGVDQSQGTTPFQIALGAQGIGFKTQYISTVEDVDQALDRGAVVSAGGCPWQDRSYGPRYQNRHYPVFHNGHCILVVGRQGGYYIVCDPLYFDGPINVSSAELEAFLTFHKSATRGVAISH